MQTEARLLQKVNLSTGLTVYFYDLSKPIAGGRCQVRLMVSIPVSIEEEYFREFAEPKPAYEEFTAALGKTVTFTLEKVRNFIAEAKAPEALEQMKQDFIDSNLSYLSSNKFSERFVTKTYKEWKEESSYRKSHLAAVRDADENT